ncbi:MAG: glycosyltransferase family 39 protein [bacterium]
MSNPKKLSVGHSLVFVKTISYAALALFSAVLLCSLWALTREWDKPLLDLHSFRQTQTAISAYYMVGNPSVLFNYITPILGKPWAIPLEVPFYQWIVARWHEWTGMGLDQSGKFVSIVFLLASLWPVWKLLEELSIPPAARWLTAAVFLSVPLHLYWGRAFLIETMGLFLSLSMAACLFAGYQKKNWRWLVTGLAFGILAALCKITTWALACGVTGLLVLFSNGIPKRKDLLWVAAAGFAAVLPIIPGKLWLSYGDQLKAENPFARDLIISTSKGQTAWNFGTLAQKTSPKVWSHIGSHITDQLLIPVPIFGHWLVPIILIVGAFANRRRAPLILIFLGGFAAGPLIFTNLYFEHNYYWVANSVWLLLASGIAFAGISECSPQSRWPGPTTIAACVVVCIAGFASWHQRFLPILQNVPSRQALGEAWIKPLQDVVPPLRTVLILGNDWSPNSLYYAERKGIAFPTADWIPLPGTQLQESLKNLGSDEQLGAVVVNEQLLTSANQAFFTNFLQQRGMSLEGKRTAFGILFPAVDWSRRK